MTRFVFWSVPLNGSRWCMRLGKLTEFHEEKNYRTPSWKIWQRPRLPVNPSSQPNDMYPSCWWDVGQPIHFAGSYPPFLLVNDGLGLRPINQNTPIWMKITTTGWTWVASELVIEVRWLNQESSWMIPKFAISVWKSTINHLFWDSMLWNSTYCWVSLAFSPNPPSQQSQDHHNFSSLHCYPLVGWRIALSTRSAHLSYMT